MAKVYAPPLDPPEFEDYYEDGRFSNAKYDLLNTEYIDKLATEARSQNTGDLVGEIIRFQIADGYAQYMVWNHRPLELVHLPIGDAWSIPEAHARGLNLKDVRELVERQKRFAELFGKK